jgi:hypothetical protein
MQTANPDRQSWYHSYAYLSYFKCSCEDFGVYPVNARCKVNPRLELCANTEDGHLVTVSKLTGPVPPSWLWFPQALYYSSLAHNNGSLSISIWAPPPCTGTKTCPQTRATNTGWPSHIGSHLQDGVPLQQSFTLQNSLGLLCFISYFVQILQLLRVSVSNS